MYLLIEGEGNSVSQWRPKDSLTHDPAFKRVLEAYIVSANATPTSDVVAADTSRSPEKLVEETFSEQAQREALEAAKRATAQAEAERLAAEQAQQEDRVAHEEAKAAAKRDQMMEMRSASRRPPMKLPSTSD